jgi:hypothetical protein
MLFKQCHIEPILNGTKTATRRIWKKPMVKIGGYINVKRRCYLKNTLPR